MRLGKRRTAALALVVGAMAVLGIAQSAAAATVSVDQPCYVEKDGKGIDTHPFTIGLAASGLPAGELLRFEISGGPGWGNSHLEEIPADGNVSYSWEGWVTESIEPITESHPLKVESLLGDKVYAETTVWMANYGMKVSDAHTKDGERVKFQFAGLAPETPIYAHYVAHGKEVFSHEMGVASAPCGALETTGQLFPAKHSHFNSYLVQFDQKKKYSAKTKLSFRHDLETGRF